MMKLVCIKPGILQYRKDEYPEKSHGKTILKIKKIGICGTDLHAFEGTQPFFSYPRVLGHELVGEISWTEKGSGFSIGQIVTFVPYFSCGSCIACRSKKPNCCVKIEVFGVHIDGGMSEYVTVPTDSLIDGTGLSPEQLALVEPLAIGAHAVARAGIGKGDKVLVVGAGPIGLGVMEFVRIAGGEVIAMDIIPERLDFCRTKIGVTHTILASAPNIEELLEEITDHDMPRVVIDATGNHRAIEKSFGYIGHGGTYLLVGLQQHDIRFSHQEFHKREATLMSSRNATRSDFLFVLDCIKKQKLDPSVYITHRIDFSLLDKVFPDLILPSSGVIKALVEL